MIGMDEARKEPVTRHRARDLTDQGEEGRKPPTTAHVYLITRAVRVNPADTREATVLKLFRLTHLVM